MSYRLYVQEHKDVRCPKCRRVRRLDKTWKTKIYRRHLSDAAVDVELMSLRAEADLWKTEIPPEGGICARCRRIANTAPLEAGESR